jgi:hypothetical protein
MAISKAPDKKIVSPFHVPIPLPQLARQWMIAPFKGPIELELELIQSQMAQKPMLRAEVYARALRASQNLKRAEVKQPPNHA